MKKRLFIDVKGHTSKGPQPVQLVNGVIDNKTCMHWRTGNSNNLNIKNYKIISTVFSYLIAGSLRIQDRRRRVDEPGRST